MFKTKSTLLPNFTGDILSSFRDVINLFSFQNCFSFKKFFLLIFRRITLRQMKANLDDAPLARIRATTICFQNKKGGVGRETREKAKPIEPLKTKTNKKQ